MSNVKASILIFSAQKVPKVRSDLLSYFIHMIFNVIGSFVVKQTLAKLFVEFLFFQIFFSFFYAKKWTPRHQN